MYANFFGLHSQDTNGLIVEHNRALFCPRLLVFTASQIDETTAHSQNKASEVEVITKMLHEHSPLSPSTIGLYIRNQTVIIRGVDGLYCNLASKRLQTNISGSQKF